MLEGCGMSQVQQRVSTLGKRNRTSSGLKSWQENPYPKITSGFGMEGWEERKEIMVWA